MIRIFFGVVGAWFIASWVFRMLTAVVHSLWLPMLPTIGYVNSVFLIAAIGGVGLIGWGAQYAWSWVCSLGE